jgi:hypothetical protein
VIWSLRTKFKKVLVCGTSMEECARQLSQEIVMRKDQAQVQNADPASFVSTDRVESERDFCHVEIELLNTTGSICESKVLTLQNEWCPGLQQLRMQNQK